MEIDAKLKEAVKNVPDAYPDFVMYIPLSAKRHGCQQQVLDFIQNTPNVTTSSVLEFLWETKQSNICKTESN